MSMDMSNYATIHYGGTPVADDAKSNYTEGFMIVEEKNYAVEGNYITGTTRQRGLAAMATSDRSLPLNFRPATATPTVAATDAGMSGINYDDEMDTTEATTANYGMRAHYTGGLTADELRHPSSDLRYKDVRPTTQAQWSHFLQKLQDENVYQVYDTYGQEAQRHLRLVYDSAEQTTPDYDNLTDRSLFAFTTPKGFAYLQQLGCLCMSTTVGESGMPNQFWNWGTSPTTALEALIYNLGRCAVSTDKNTTSLADLGRNYQNVAAENYHWNDYYADEYGTTTYEAAPAAAGAATKISNTARNGEATGSLYLVCLTPTKEMAKSLLHGENGEELLFNRHYDGEAYFSYSACYWDETSNCNANYLKGRCLPGDLKSHYLELLPEPDRRRYDAYRMISKHYHMAVFEVRPTFGAENLRGLQALVDNYKHERGDYLSFMSRQVFLTERLLSQQLLQSAVTKQGYVAFVSSNLLDYLSAALEAVSTTTAKLHSLRDVAEALGTTEADALLDKRLSDMAMDYMGGVAKLAYMQDARCPTLTATTAGEKAHLQRGYKAALLCRHYLAILRDADYIVRGNMDMLREAMTTAASSLSNTNEDYNRTAMNTIWELLDSLNPHQLLYIGSYFGLAKVTTALKARNIGITVVQPTMTNPYVIRSVLGQLVAYTTFDNRNYYFDNVLKALGHYSKCKDSYYFPVTTTTAQWTYQDRMDYDNDPTLQKELERAVKGYEDAFDGKAYLEATAKSLFGLPTAQASTETTVATTTTAADATMKAESENEPTEAK